VLDGFVPWDSSTAAMLRAYFDASTKATGTFCVAGIAYGSDSAKKAEREWRSLFGNRICHMTDMHGRHGEFANLGDGEGGELLKSAVRIIRRYASYGVAISLNLNDIQALLPTKAAKGSEYILSGFRQAYGIGCHLAMHTLGRMVKVRGERSEPSVAYIFESGDAFQAQSHQYISASVQKGSVLRDIYSYRSHEYLEKAGARLLESADILAWEWATHIDRLNKGQHVRPSIEALMGDPDRHVADRVFAGRKFYGMHISKRGTERFMTFMRAILLARSSEEVFAILKRHSSDPAPLTEAELQELYGAG
jgi:hypothetical protein